MPLGRQRIPAPAPAAEKVTPRHSIPAWPFDYSGQTVLILGYGPTLYDDVARARELRPDADQIAVNMAMTEYPADHLFSWHFHEAGKLQNWRARHIEKFGHGALTHCPTQRNRETGVLNPVPDGFDWVDYWWPGATADGSGPWMAVRMAHFMGYAEIILCGVPMEIGGYANGHMAKAFQRQPNIDRFRGAIAGQTDYHAKTKSMSGWTKELLGTIEA